MSYELLKTLHVLGAVLFIGNIIVTALWKALADRTRDAAIIGFGQRLVLITDVVFTAVGIVLLAWTGPAMTSQAGGLGSAWVAWGTGLFAVAGLLWITVLVPVEILQARLARGFAHGGDIPQRYWQLANVWMGAGTMATILLLVTLGLMVMKPV